MRVRISSSERESGERDAAASSSWEKKSTVPPWLGEMVMGKGLLGIKDRVIIPGERG